MRKSDVEQVVELPPAGRAVQYLIFGSGLSGRRKAVSEKRLPPQLRRESIAGSVAAPIIERMHGIKTFDPTVQMGLVSTGRRLLTDSGAIDDLVLTRVHRKRVAALAMDDSRDRSVNDTAIRQLAVGMLDSDPIARCCAAYGYWQATGSRAALPVMQSATSSDDENERTVAAHCLAKTDIRRVRSLQGTKEDDIPNTPAQRIRSSMTLIIHGTFAKDHSWYQPSGDFHSYIKQDVYPDVYSGNDFFFWSGRYSLSDNGLRRIWTAAANKLVSWINSHPTHKLRLIAHSAGNNVVNIATKNIQACSLIQLSPAVRSSILPNMQNVSSSKLFNIHSTIDLVLSIDGGAQNYKNTAVATFETIKKISFIGHSDSHDADKWKKKNVPQLVTTVCQ